MAYTYINREIYPNMLVLDEPLDDNYAKGNSYDDYILVNANSYHKGNRKQRRTEFVF